MAKQNKFERVKRQASLPAVKSSAYYKGEHQSRGRTENKAFSNDGSKYSGYASRENGRYGSFASHDDYSEDSWS